ncbi:MAG: M23 family metallopeptidase [Synergistaceae bacterium]|nr:M23 family metallopeptidase [Synergistaceae bacterium]
MFLPYCTLNTKKRHISAMFNKQSPTRITRKRVIFAGLCFVLVLLLFPLSCCSATPIDYKELQEEPLETAFRKISSPSDEQWEEEQDVLSAGAPDIANNIKWPLASGQVAGKFNISGKGRKHTGIDILSPKGAPIYAVLDGVVEMCSNGGSGYRGYGKVLVINHDNKLWSLYSHCTTLDANVGKIVKQGDVVATVGRTGRATTNHVHFEVRNSNGRPLNPLKYLPENSFITILQRYQYTRNKIKTTSVQ